MTRKKNSTTHANKYRLRECRICKSKNLYTFLSLDTMPIPNGFLKSEELHETELHYPLGTAVCQSCWLVQLTHVVPPEIMFKNYLYLPSTSTTMVEHFKSMAHEIVDSFRLKPGDLAIDIGSNDGTLLGNFKNKEMQVLGIDPASNLAQVARLKGIETIDDFFTKKLANEVLKKYGAPKIITGTNVFAHIHDLHDVCAGIYSLLHKKGVFIVEFPYLVDLLNKNEFDTIYHEHLSYFAIRPLRELFGAHDMYIFDAKKIGVHGGSVRIYVAKNNSGYKINPVVDAMVREEGLKKLNTRAPYDDFGRRVRVIRRDIKNYLLKLRKEGKRVVGYGASAKGNVLLNYCGIGNNILDYIVDSIHYKQGRFTPGTHIPIYPEARLDKDNPDYVLLLAWNFADEILRKQVSYRERGGQFIVTIPYLRVE